MSARQANLEFAPPPTPGLMRGVLLAIVAHSALVFLLALGVQWKRDATVVTAEAELWSALPQEAAPRPAPPPEPSPPEPTPLKPLPAPVPEQVSPPQPDPAIAIAREKARLRDEKLEQDKAIKLKAAKDAQALRDKLEAEKKLAAAKSAAEKLAAEKLAADKKRQQATSPPDPAADAKKLAELRQQNLKRMAGLAGAGTGSDSSQSTAAQSSGPSASYAGRIRARIKPNITFTDTISGNPLAEVEVRTSPDGTVISRKITLSSGVKAWDDAVLAAIDKTEVLPRDTDGRVPSVLIIGFKPRD